MTTKPNSSYWKLEQKNKEDILVYLVLRVELKRAFISGAAVHGPVGEGGWGLVWTMENGTACVCPIQRNSN